MVWVIIKHGSYAILIENRCKMDIIDFLIWIGQVSILKKNRKEDIQKVKHFQEFFSTECRRGYFGWNCKLKCGTGFYGRLCRNPCKCPASKCHHEIGCITGLSKITLWFFFYLFVFVLFCFILHLNEKMRIELFKIIASLYT
jgi:hypothetical protein